MLLKKKQKLLNYSKSKGHKFSNMSKGVYAANILYHLIVPRIQRKNFSCFKEKMEKSTIGQLISCTN